MGGLGAAERILGTASDDARIVFLTTFSDDEYIVRALRLGAKGYLVKQEVATIAPALRAVVAGQNVLGTEVLDRMDALMQGGDDAVFGSCNAFGGPFLAPVSRKRAALCVPAGVSAGRKRKACTGRETGERTCRGTP